MRRCLRDTHIGVLSRCQTQAHGQPARPSTHALTLVFRPPLVRPMALFLATGGIAGVLMHFDMYRPSSKAHKVVLLVSVRTVDTIVGHAGTERSRQIALSGHQPGNFRQR